MFFLKITITCTILLAVDKNTSLHTDYSFKVLNTYKTNTCYKIQRGDTVISEKYIQLVLIVYTFIVMRFNFLVNGACARSAFSHNSSEIPISEKNKLTKKSWYPAGGLPVFSSTTVK